MTKERDKSMNIHGCNLVAGKKVSVKGSSFKAVSPFDQKELSGIFQEATFSEVELAMSQAEAAFEIFRKTSDEERAAFLERIADEILAIGDELILRANQETGLPRERLVGERQRTMNQLRLFASTIRDGSWKGIRVDTAMPDRKPLPRSDLRRIMVPIGPIVVFGASNFPLAFSVAGGDTASALATGNPVVVKAHRAHPGTSEWMAEAICCAVRACKLPLGVFSMLHGSGEKIGTALVEHHATRAVGFTGSRKAGRSLFDIAAARPHPIPVFAEMSSLNPLFILPGALKSNKKAIAQGLIQSITNGVGQFCTKPGLVFALEGETLAEFIGEFKNLLEKVVPGTMLSPGICNAFHEGRKKITQIPEVQLIGQAETAPDPAKTQGDATVLKITVHEFLKNPDFATEVFGPFSLFVTAKSQGELEQAAKAMEGQLTATIHAVESDFTTVQKLIPILESKAGRLIFNGFPTGVEVCPSMVHGGPYPATTDGRFTSVGTSAMDRFLRPVCYQDFPEGLLPNALQDESIQSICRLVNNQWRTSQEIEIDEDGAKSSYAVSK
jgi:2,5-dioxopentanoate dehydrogenase